MIGGPPIIEFEKTNRTVTCKKIGAKTLSLNFLGQGSLTYGLIYESLRSHNFEPISITPLTQI